jgi:hypothetical protein
MRWTGRGRPCDHEPVTGLIDFEFLVIGLFGSAAARHLSAAADRVVLMGPDEPADRTAHDGVHAGQSTRARFSRGVAPNRMWVEMTARYCMYPEWLGGACDW